MEDKCYFTRKRKTKSATEKWMCVRITAEEYNRVCGLCDVSGLPISTVTTKLLDFALEHAEVVDE